jgi:hypothetical protein
VQQVTKVSVVQTRSEEVEWDKLDACKKSCVM